MKHIKQDFSLNAWVPSPGVDFGDGAKAKIKLFRNMVMLHIKELLAIRRIFSLVDMITNTKFSNCPNVFKIGVVKYAQQATKYV